MGWFPCGDSTNEQELTLAEYDALTDDEKNDGTTYYITDINGDGSQFQPVIYSLEEREIGVWTDGKPLYQKTIKVTSPSSSSSFQNMDLSSLNIDTCVSIDGYAVRNSSGTKLVYFLSSQEDANYYCFARYKKSDGNLNYKTNFSSSTVDEVVFNIQYTKSTDTAGSGTWTPQGVPAVHYSTTEHVVGTWIDGKTLYEKTVSFTLGTANTYNSYVTDIEYPDSSCMMIDYSSSYYIFQGTYPCCIGISSYNGASGTNAVCTLLTKVNNKIRIDYTCGNDASGNVVYITVRYTKSS